MLKGHLKICNIYSDFLKKALRETGKEWVLPYPPRICNKTFIPARNPVSVLTAIPWKHFQYYSHMMVESAFTAVI